MILIYKLWNLILVYQIYNAINHSDKHSKNTVYKLYNMLISEMVMVDKLICNEDNFQIQKTYNKNHKHNNK